MIAFPNDDEAKLACPQWVDEALIAETKAVWEPIYGHGLTDSDALAILLNVGRLIDAIQEQ